MTRHKQNRNAPINGRKFLPNFPKAELSAETQKSIWAIIVFTIAVLLILSSLKIGGVIGRYIYIGLSYLFGLGYYLLPVILILAAINFLRKTENRVYFNTFLGSAFIFLSLLGLFEIFSEGKGGLFGQLGHGLKFLFGFWAALIVLIAVFITGVLVMFNLPLRMPKFLLRKKSTDQVIIPDNLNQDQASILKPDELMVNGTTGEIKDDLKKGKNYKTKEDRQFTFTPPITANYKYPPLDIFDNDSSKPTPGDIKANANIIKRTLQNFGIEVEMGEVNVGPTVTQYTLKPAEGVKLASIIALQNDLSLALAAHPLRIEAPIPGKALVGIEVPNRAIALVRLGNLLSDPQYASVEAPLVLALGRDVTGTSTYASLTRMPHLLIAGATGTGKSVSIHSILCSLLYKNSPEILRFILIDPKRIELSHYNGIPHLLTPVICDLKKVLPALKWAISEMERRYQHLLEYNVRDVNGYNIKAAKKGESILPYIVIIIDELADLMVQYGKEVEGAIIRLAQMARATGIHLIVSTQRPSVEVITGLIKANITCRIAFEVASQVDSRTILDMAGAEKLLGHGDMLYLAPENNKARRLQGAYVSEREVEKLVDFLVSQADAVGGEMSNDLEQALLNNGNANSNQNFIDLDAMSGDDDELYDEAYDVVVLAGKASASLLQRRLRVGYARAARLLDLLEEKGIIGPGDGAKPRQVFISKDDVKLDQEEINN